MPTIVFTFACLTASPHAHADESLGTMLNQGIALTPTVRIPLPPPTFIARDGHPVSDEVANQALKTMAGGLGVKRFTRDSVVAPISTRIKAIKGADGQRIGHLIDIGFVVHLGVKEIKESETVESFASDSEPRAESGESNSDPTEANVARALTKEELDAFGITCEEDREAFGLLQFPLLGKVILRGVGHARRSLWSSESRDPVILTWQLDPRFSDPSPESDSLSNQWRAIERNDVGRKTLGEPQPYQGHRRVHRDFGPANLFTVRKRVRIDRAGSVRAP